jgi:hypothetical protein
MKRDIYGGRGYVDACRARTCAYVSHRRIRLAAQGSVLGQRRARAYAAVGFGLYELFAVLF